MPMNASVTPIQHPSAWRGADLCDRQDWIWRLDASENEALHSATQAARRKGLGIPALTAGDFPLGPMADKIRQVRDEVMNGRGFVLVKGFDIDRYSIEDAALAYWGLGMHMGAGSAQNAQGDLLGHVTNLGVDYRTDPNVRGYQTRFRLPFHNDAMDIVGLLCVCTAQSGGESLLVSSTTLHNEVLRRRPDLLPVGYADFCMDRRGEAPPGKLPYYRGPMFNPCHGRVLCRYNRGYIESAQRFADVPRLTPAQIEFLDLMDALCADPQLHLSMILERGDMQFISNYTTLHSRTEYEDGPDRQQQRYLLRLWLDTGLLQDLPQSYADRYEDMRLWLQHPRPPIFDLSAIREELAH
jgi:hypothetical protein